MYAWKNKLQVSRGFQTPPNPTQNQIKYNAFNYKTVLWNSYRQTIERLKSDFDNRIKIFKLTQA